MLKHAIINILGVLVAVLAGLALSNADQAEYTNVLNHSGLSDQAFVYHTKSTKTVSTAIKQLEQIDDLNDYQVQFAVSRNKTLFYAKGEYTTLPIKSGHFFSSADFDSTLPVMVVGANVTQRLYKAGEQSYLYSNGRYIPVIGVVGTQEGNRLNDHIFINASSTRKTDDPQLNNVEIFVDGVDESELSDFSRIFVAKPHQITVAKTQTSHKSWWQLHAIWLLALIGTAIAMSLIALLAAWIAPRAQVKGLDAPQTNRYLWGMGSNYMPGMAGAIVVGSAISWWRFYMNNHFRLVIIAIGLFLVFVITTQVFMHMRLRKEQQ